MESDQILNHEANDDERSSILLCQDGDLTAFEGLVKKYQQRIYNFCLTMLKGDIEEAEDLTQDIFIKAFKALPRYKAKVKFFTWLYKIAVNSCIDRQRSPFWKLTIKGFFRGEDTLPQLIGRGSNR